jgi:hypothetical protein
MPAFTPIMVVAFRAPLDREQVLTAQHRVGHHFYTIRVTQSVISIYSCIMAVRTPAELRAAAEEFRRLSTEGEDPRLQAALLLVADEFDQEANEMEAKAPNQMMSMGHEQTCHACLVSGCKSHHHLPQSTKVAKQAVIGHHSSRRLRLLLGQDPFRFRRFEVPRHGHDSEIPAAIAKQRRT